MIWRIKWSNKFSIEISDNLQIFSSAGIQIWLQMQLLTWGIEFTLSLKFWMFLVRASMTQDWRLFSPVNFHLWICWSYQACKFQGHFYRIFRTWKPQIWIRWTCQTMSWNFRIWPNSIQLNSLICKKFCCFLSSVHKNMRN